FANHRSLTLIRRCLPGAMSLCIIPSRSHCMTDLERNNCSQPPRWTAITSTSPSKRIGINTRFSNDGLADDDEDTFMTIEKTGGGGGNAARAAVLQRENDGTTVVVESNRVLLSNITGTTDMSIDDFTPIAQLTTDYEVWMVKAGSEYDSAEQVLEQ